MNRVIAVAVAKDERQITIDHRRDLKELRRLKVRPYLRGLVQGLAACGKKLGPDYTIEFRQRRPGQMADAAAFSNPLAGDVVFCMSTTVVKAAADVFSPTAAPPVIPIVGVVSAPDAEKNTAGTAFSAIANICGVNAKRTQNADKGFLNFLRAIPTLTEVKVLARKDTEYPPSDRALKDVTTAAGKKGIKCTPLQFSDVAGMETLLEGLNPRDPKVAPTIGVLVLPIDVCLGHAQEIIDLVQGEKKLPTFFPVPDWVRPNGSGAFGAFGVPQRVCGELMAERVNAIWRNGNAVPGGQFEKWVEVAPDAFQFVVSAAIASDDELNIDIPANIPQI
jgi:hypothetical protein